MSQRLWELYLQQPTITILLILQYPIIAFLVRTVLSAVIQSLIPPLECKTEFKRAIWSQTDCHYSMVNCVFIWQQFQSICYLFQQSCFDLLFLFRFMWSLGELCIVWVFINRKFEEQTVKDSAERALLPSQQRTGVEIKCISSGT